MSLYREYFGFKKDPFSNDIPTKSLLHFPAMEGVKERIDYALKIGAAMVLTGDVGSGKSTSLRWSLSHYHPSEVLILNIIASTGSLAELYKQLCWALDLEIRGTSLTSLTKIVKATIKDIASSKKQKILLAIDESHLLRADIFMEIHTLTQFENDSKNLLAIVFTGQSNLLDKLMYRSSAPMASRVVAKTHLNTITRDQMEEYLSHHVRYAGVKKNLFTESAITAIQQGSGGVLRKANNLAKGALIASSREKENQATAEHVRIASTELI
ncbi:MAG: AAA family ATPase [Gammaproteobacteria bacterium]|nr:MAG: AAA family ATPase [Gammaproteobacteria bacterium]